MKTPIEANIERAFRELREPLLRYARQRLRNDDDAHDIVQQVFLRLAARKDLPPAGELSAYLYRSVRNALIDRARRRGHDEVEFHEAVVPAVADARKESETRAAIETCLRSFVDALPADDREWIRSVDLQGQSQRELAERRGLPYSSAKSRVQRARERLRAEFLRCCHVHYDAAGALAGMQPGEHADCGSC